MMNWIEARPFSRNDAIASRFNDSLILNHELAKRNLHTIKEVNAFLDPAIYPQASPFSFPEMEKSISRITKAIRNEEIIGIWGDFDADGQTSTAVLIDGLSRMGANVIYHIPVRASESHGMQLKAFKSFMKHHPTLIITCDTGISEYSTIEYARSIKVDVIITDHHTLPIPLPNAYSIVNPHQLPDSHPLSFLAGVGTAFQIIRALDEKVICEFDIENLYDLVALGTIADLAEIKLENRFYAQMGLMQMNQNFRTAFAAMFEISQTRISNINENTLGFNIAPRLNASGRLSDANENVNFLLSDDQIFCRKFAKHLEQLNMVRKAAVDSVLMVAERIIKNTPSLVNEPVLILSNQGWEQGVLGIAASNLAESYHRPVILLNIENGIAAGSVRSIKGIDITSAITENDQHLIHYGGHPMAAGLSISIEKITVFSKGLMKSVANQLDKLPSENELVIDHSIGINSISDQLLIELVQLSPFGQGNPTPIFASRNLEIISTTPLGTTEKHSKITVQDIKGSTKTLISWNSEIQSIPFDRIDFAYYIRPDEYQGNNSYYLEYIDHQEYNPNTISLEASAGSIEFEDHRQAIDQLLSVENICLQNKDLQIWFEGLGKPAGFDVRDRTQLQKKEHLLILSAPQSFAVLNEVIEKSTPKKIYFCNLQNDRDDIKTFLSGLGGFIKHHLKNPHAEISLKSLSIQFGQTEETIFNGLSWFKEKGNICFLCDSHGKIMIENGLSKNSVESSKIEINLNKSLKETSAFRQYYKRVKPTLLLRKIEG